MKRFIGWIFMGAEATVALCVLGWWIGAVTEAGKLRDENSELVRTIEENFLQLRDETRVTKLLKKLQEEAIPSAVETLTFKVRKLKENSDVETFLREELEKMKSDLRKKAKKLQGLRHFPSDFGLDDMIKKKMSSPEKEEFVRRLTATGYLLKAVLVPGVATVAAVKQLHTKELIIGDILLRRYPIELSFEASPNVIEQVLGATCLKDRFLLIERLRIEPAAKENNLRTTVVFSVLQKVKTTREGGRRHPSTGRKPPHIFRRRY